MEYPEEQWLMLSGLQHFAFCRRQWALIHLEQAWQENLQTAEGMLMHRRAHDAGQAEMRGGRLALRGLSVHSARLGVSGACDVVEFTPSPAGVPLAGRPGLWQAYPVEYKRGSAKLTDADRLQLCCQAMCLEEMLCCQVPAGALFYGQTRRREEVCFSAGLRQTVRAMLCEMHQLAARGYTPKCRPARRCGACSLKPLCLPGTLRGRSAQSYLDMRLSEMEGSP